MLELFALNDGYLPGADPAERQQLLQEFFFHLVGAIDWLAQFTNEAKHLGLPVEDVTVAAVLKALPEDDPIWATLKGLHANPWRDPPPPDPYNDAGLVYRLWRYRHHVTHRGKKSFLFTMELGVVVASSQPEKRWASLRRFRRAGGAQTNTPVASSFFRLDPSNPGGGDSNRPLQEEMERMLRLVEDGCEAVLAAS